MIIILFALLKPKLFFSPLSTVTIHLLSRIVDYSGTSIVVGSLMLNLKGVPLYIQKKMRMVSQ